MKYTKLDLLFCSVLASFLTAGAYSFVTAKTSYLLSRDVYNCAIIQESEDAAEDECLVYMHKDTTLE